MSYWKNQLVARDSSYEIEIAAKIIAVQFARAYHFSFRMLGFKIDGPVQVLGDDDGRTNQNCALMKNSREAHIPISHDERSNR